MKNFKLINLILTISHRKTWNLTKDKKSQKKSQLAISFLCTCRRVWMEIAFMTQVNFTIFPSASATLSFWKILLLKENHKTHDTHTLNGHFQNIVQIHKVKHYTYSRSIICWTEHSTGVICDFQFRMKKYEKNTDSWNQERIKYIKWNQ